MAVPARHQSPCSFRCRLRSTRATAIIRLPSPGRRRVRSGVAIAQNGAQFRQRTPPLAVRRAALRGIVARAGTSPAGLKATGSARSRAECLLRLSFGQSVAPIAGTPLVMRNRDNVHPVLARSLPVHDIVNGYRFNRTYRQPAYVFENRSGSATIISIAASTSDAKPNATPGLRCAYPSNESSKSCREPASNSTAWAMTDPGQSLAAYRLPGDGRSCPGTNCRRPTIKFRCPILVERQFRVVRNRFP